MGQPVPQRLPLRTCPHRRERRMTGRPSAATEKALALIAKGMTPYAAAKKVGIALSTIYRALAKRRKK
jgi:hypothetical protein